MTISTTTVVDDNDKVIVKAEGVGSETDQLLINALELSNASSKPVLSISSVHYNIIGSGNVTLNFATSNSNEEALVIDGKGNYGLKPNEPKILAEDTSATGNILLTSDSNITEYIVVIECRKEKGFRD
jgi:hypothetical protein